MYLQHFGLIHPPLGKEATELRDDGALAQSAERFAWLLQSPGIGLITGEPGVGKTAALRYLTRSLVMNAMMRICPGRSALYKAARVRPDALAISLMPRARQIAPKALPIRLPSPGSSRSLDDLLGPAHHLGMRHDAIDSYVALGREGFANIAFHDVKPIAQNKFQHRFRCKSALVVRNVKWIALGLAFALPVVLLLVATKVPVLWLLATAVVSQLLGLLAERWLFFAQANHPQNIYYQAVA